MLCTHRQIFRFLAFYSTINIVWRFPSQLTHTDKKLSTGFKGSHLLLFMHTALTLSGLCMGYRNTSDTWLNKFKEYGVSMDKDKVAVSDLSMTVSIRNPVTATCLGQGSTLRPLGNRLLFHITPVKYSPGGWRRGGGKGEANMSAFWFLQFQTPPSPRYATVQNQGGCCYSVVVNYWAKWETSGVKFIATPRSRTVVS